MYYIKTVSQEQVVTFVMRPHYIKVSPSSSCYIESNEEEAQGIVLNSVPYSINNDNPISGVETAIVISQDDWDEDIQKKYADMQCNNAQQSKLAELSNACNTTINVGTQVQLSDGSTESFTYDLADQSNVSEMFNAVLLGATEYPYHANDDDCRMYSAQDITTIYVTLSSYKTAQTTYHNQLKQYVKALETADEVNAVVYGQELIGTYLDKYNELMAQAKAQLDNIVAKVQNNEMA